MSKPDWKLELGTWIEAWIGGSETTQRTALASLSLYLDDAYHRGLMAGRSQAGYATTRRKKKEESWSAPSASDTDASASASGTARDASSLPASAPRGEP